MWNLAVANLIRGRLNKIYTFISYWYMRYLLVTELYIVEPWERALMHVVMMVALCTLSYFNVHLVDFLGTITNGQKKSIHLNRIR